MDFMNLNQSAHGDREFGYLATRTAPPSEDRRRALGRTPGSNGASAPGARAARGWHDVQQLRIARLGDNMRNVAVTEGDKVEAQIRLGFSVNGYGVGELVAARSRASRTPTSIGSSRSTRTSTTSFPSSDRGAARHDSLRDAARIELGLRAFLDDVGANAFTDTFEDLTGLRQLPGIAVQRLMADGYGFGAEGDWKTAALVRIVKMMSAGLEGGTSFMEDYTYNLGAETPQILGAHMLEVCPSIAARSAQLRDPSARHRRRGTTRSGSCSPRRRGRASSSVSSTSAPGFAWSRTRSTWSSPSTICPGCRWRAPSGSRARTWRPRRRRGSRPAARTTPASRRRSPIEALEDLAEIAGVELVTITSDTTARGLRRELRWNQAYHHLAGAL